jgi:hypothetical protein
MLLIYQNPEAWQTLPENERCSTARRPSEM